VTIVESRISRNNTAFIQRHASQRPGLLERILTRFLARISKGRLTIELMDGRQLAFAGSEPGPEADLRINDPRCLIDFMLAGDLGLAEAFMAGRWDTPDLDTLLAFGLVNESSLSGALAMSWPVRLLNRLRHDRRANTRKGSRRNIAAHYDLGNEFYRLWLDDSMTYSAGIYRNGEDSLAAAQRRKYLRLAHQLQLKPGDSILEIGCGWGGFAEIAAKEFGCHVVGITLSREQAAYATARMAAAGLGDRVEIRYQDYRDVEGEFDKIASIEMCEAVGEENWPLYFGIIHDRLRPGGLAALQVITIDDSLFDSYRRSADFIQRYIFPGGMLPSPSAIADVAGSSGLTLADSFFFGKSYARTLEEWKQAFRKNWPAIERLGFDRRFFRMWLYYLCYCEAGFDQGRIDVGHFLLERP
jgi:cyclopropane-fatty-acyl-phospholipid synthase